MRMKMAVMRGYSFWVVGPSEDHLGPGVGMDGGQPRHSLDVPVSPAANDHGVAIRELQWCEPADDRVWSLEGLVVHPGPEHFALAPPFAAIGSEIRSLKQSGLVLDVRPSWRHEV